MSTFSYGLGLEPNQAVLRFAEQAKPVYAVIQNEFYEQTCETLTFYDYTTTAQPHVSFFALLAAEIACRRAVDKGFRGDRFVVVFSTMVMATRAAANDDR